MKEKVINLTEFVIDMLKFNCTVYPYQPGMFGAKIDSNTQF